MKLLLATTNRGKILEFRQMLSSAGDIQFTDLAEHRELPPVEETGRTFLANACLKAAGYARQLACWSLADDSGLAVDALGGNPGVFSARWAAMNSAGAGDADNNRLLLKQLNAIPDERRTARFVCSLALADPAGRVILTASDAVEGQIIREIRGAGGFGYDPLFLVPELGKTTAELNPDEKHRISHRGKAMRRMVSLLRKMGLADPGAAPLSAPPLSGHTNTI